MPIARFLPFAAAGLVVALTAFAPADAVAQAASTTTRAQVKMDRDAFLALMRWDEMMGLWVLRSGMEPPAGVMSREQVLAMRDKFLSMNRYDEIGGWMPIQSGPRDMSKLTREQVQMETVRFLMTHRFDESKQEWVSKMR